MARHRKPPKVRHRHRKPPKPKKPKTVHAHHPPVQEGKSTPASGGQPHAMMPTGGSSAKDLLADAGLSSVLLELVSEGVSSLAQGLAAWQREQDRVTNRAWRRPGGMARMGGL